LYRLKAAEKALRDEDFGDYYENIRNVLPMLDNESNLQSVISLIDQGTSHSALQVTNTMSAQNRQDIGEILFHLKLLRDSAEAKLSTVGKREGGSPQPA
jgi:hypothetical protein